mmetsp:Transcript_29498/g.33667  ORF Transcript_29498/g.33667 Transcript_29498/m.33667 type:complete len:93 (+) Transcript_29498:188-466(+)
MKCKWSERGLSWTMFGMNEVKSRNSKGICICSMFMLALNILGKCLFSIYDSLNGFNYRSSTYLFYNSVRKPFIEISSYQIFHDGSTSGTEVI